MFRRILVAVDGSNDSDRAAAAGADVAKAHGSELHVCHVFHVPEHYAGDFSEPLRAAVREDGERILAHAAGVAEKEGVKATTHLLKEGHPAEAIIRLADELGVGLIVVGVRGRTQDQLRTMGSVSETVARKATCSVLIVRKKS